MEFGPKKILLFQEGGGWIAQCLDHDIVTQGDNIKQAQERMILTIICQITLALKVGKTPLSDVEKAPEKYWKLFEQGLSLEFKDKSSEKYLSDPRLSENISPHMLENVASDTRIYA